VAAEKHTTGDGESVSEGSVSMDTTDDQAEVFARLAPTTRNRRGRLHPMTDLECEIDQAETLTSVEMDRAATSSSATTDTFPDTSQQQLPWTLHANEYIFETDAQAAQARARDRQYRELQSHAAQFRATTHDPMIGGRELNAPLSRQSSIDQALGGGLGGMEDDEEFRNFVDGARLARRRPGVVPGKTADVMDVVRYVDQQ